MALRTLIADSETGLQAAVDNAQGDETRAAVVATRPLKIFDPAYKFFLNDDYGAEMAIPGGLAGVPLGIYDGGDQNFWTALAIKGTWDFVADDTHAKQAVITITNANNCANDTQTIGVGGADTTITEGVDWNLVGGDNDATATALAAELDTITGVSATATGAVVSIIADPSHDITKCNTSDVVSCPGSGRSVDAIAAGRDGEAAFTAGAPLDLTTYDVVSGWIYITSWKAGKHIEFWGKDAAGGAVGNKVNIEDYLDTAALDEWQRFIVPLTDLDLVGKTVSSVRIKIKDALLMVYIDLIEWEDEGGGAGIVEYEVSPDAGTWLHITEVRHYFVDALAATPPALAYDKILGETLLEGYRYEQWQGGVRVTSETIHSLGELLWWAGTTYQADGDGTNTVLVVSLKLPVPIILKHKDLDRLKIIIQEDLTGLIHMRVSTTGFVEIHS